MSVGLKANVDGTSGAVQVNGNDVVTVNSSGNVGIGTSSPQQRLDVSQVGGNSFAGIRAQNNNVGTGIGGIEFSSDTTYAKSAIGLVRQNANGQGALVFYNASSTGAANWSTADERMRIASTGNVGIGTSAPAAKLEVAASDLPSIRLNSGASGKWKSEIIFGNGVNNKWATGVDLGNNGDNNFFWFDIVNSAERMRITSDGSLLVGTTANNGGGTFNASARNATSAAIISGNGNTGDTAYAVHLFYKRDNNNTTSQVFCQFAINNNSVTSGQINANGANQVAFGSWSDRRLKENIIDLPPQLANICALRPVEFDYIASEGGGHQIGFIAQEIQKVYPDTVGEREDGMLTLSGWSKTEARLVKAIQEQQTIIEDLRARVAALEAK